MLHGYLKQSTASQSKLVGPFVDDTDFKTAETGLTIANTDVKLSKNAATGVNKNSGGGTHRNNGMYSLTFDATDTNTVGELSGSILVSGALIVLFKFMVLEEAVFDALFASSAPGYLQPTTAGRTLDVTSGGAAGVDWGNVENPGTTVDLSDTAINLADTVTTNSDMRGTDGANTTTPPTAAANADAVWDEVAAGHVTAGSFGAKNQNQVPSETLNDYKATGFSTHSAADVWTSGTRTLTSFGTLIADIWANATRTLTALVSGAATEAKQDTIIAAQANQALDSTVAKEATLSATDTVVDNIYIDTQRVDALLENSGGDRYTAKALETAPSGGGGGGGDATEAKQDTILAKLLAYVQLLARKDAAIATDNATELTAINADGGSGAGAFTVTTDSQEGLADGAAGGGATAQQVWEYALEAGYTAEELMRFQSSILGGLVKKVGNGTPEFLSLNGNKVRVKYETDDIGNRVRRISIDLT